MRLGKSDLLSWISCSLVGLCSYAAEGMPVRWMHTSSLREVSLQSFGHVSLFAPLQPRCGSTLSLVEDVSDIVLMHNAEKDLSVVALSFDMDEHILRTGLTLASVVMLLINFGRKPIQLREMHCYNWVILSEFVGIDSMICAHYRRAGCFICNRAEISIGSQQGCEEFNVLKQGA